MTESSAVPNTNRPTNDQDTLDDIRATKDSHRPLITVHDTQRLIDVPGALRALDDLIDSIRRCDGTAYENTHGFITAWAYPTQDELLHDLAAAQARYDRGRELYAHYVDTGEFPQYRSTWRDYLAAEGLAEPADDADD